MVAPPLSRRLRNLRRARAAADPRRGDGGRRRHTRFMFWRLDDDGNGGARRRHHPSNIGPLAYRAGTPGLSDELRSARAQHNSTQEVITLQQLLKSGERIDIALFYDGINEMACAEQTGRADGLFNEARRRAEFNLLHPQRRSDLIVAALMAAAPRTL